MRVLGKNVAVSNSAMRPRDSDSNATNTQFPSFQPPSPSSTTMANIHVRRPLQINLHALLQQQAPTIELGVQSYENSTRNFLEAVTNYKNRAMTTIAERRRHQAQEKKKFLDKTAAVELETGQCKLREIELVARMLTSSASS